MLQQISDVAWLVHQGDERLGILNKDVQEHYTYISGQELLDFYSADEVKQHFGNLSLFEAQIETPPKKQDAYYIKGYEVDYPEPFAVAEDDPGFSNRLPLYTKIENGSIYYAAGYYCIKFAKGWKHSNGPKLATLEKYEYEGPFKTELEMRQRLKTLNKGLRKNGQS